MKKNSAASGAGSKYWVLPSNVPLNNEANIIKFIQSWKPATGLEETGKNVDERTAAVRLSASVGELGSQQTQGGVSLGYKTGDEPKEVAKSLGLAQVEEPFIFAISFVVKDDVDPFTLGELSGSIKNIIGIGLANLKFELKSKMESDPRTAKPLYTLVFNFSKQTEVLAALSQLLDYYNPQKVNLNLDFTPGLDSSAPSTNKDEFVQLKLQLELELSRNIFKIIEAFTSPTEATRRILSLVRATKGVNLDFQFENLQEFWHALLQRILSVEDIPDSQKEIKSDHIQNLNWNTLSTHIRSPSFVNLQMLLDPSLPEPARDTYRKLTEYLTGVSSVRVVVGKKHAFDVRLHHLDLFTLLPSLEEIKQSAAPAK